MLFSRFFSFKASECLEIIQEDVKSSFFALQKEFCSTSPLLTRFTAFELLANLIYCLEINFHRGIFCRPSDVDNFSRKSNFLAYYFGNKLIIFFHAKKSKKFSMKFPHKYLAPILKFSPTLLLK